jgi:hypothetical protein
MLCLPDIVGCQKVYGNSGKSLELFNRAAHALGDDLWVGVLVEAGANNLYVAAFSSPSSIQSKA